MDPKVSILIPLYNSEKYISETIESVLYQTYKNIEIIIVDDHSTDNSYFIALKYQKEYPKIISVYKNPKKGACSARNYAFERSTGDYIQYLDADDVLHKTKIEKQIHAIINNPDTIANGIWGRFYNNTKDVKWENQYINKDYSNPIQWLIDSWNGHGMAQTSIWLTPRYIINKAGPWNEKLLVNQDGEFFSRVILNSSKIIHISDTMVYYRSGLNNSVSKIISKEKAESLLLSYILYKKNLIDYLYSDTIRYALMRNFLKFIYLYYDIYPDLIIKAKNEIKLLGFNKLEITGGRNFKKVAKIIGFEKTLKLRAFINTISSYIRNKTSNHKKS